MARKGLLIDYEYCTGCHTCEVACKQQHQYPAGKWGIKVNEIILETFTKVEVSYLRFLGRWLLWSKPGKAIYS